MKQKVLLSLLIISVFCCLIKSDIAATVTGNSLKYISSCEIDLNNDGIPDVALLLETQTGRQLIVLLKTPNGYNGYVAATDKPDMYLSCHFGKTVTASKAVGEENITYTTPGAYLKLTLPEGSSAVYFWNGSGFTEVWTSD